MYVRDYAHGKKLYMCIRIDVRMYALFCNPCCSKSLCKHCHSAMSYSICCVLVTFSIQISMSIFQLGFVSLFLSSALVSGYTTGAAVHVATSQIRHLLDIPQANISVPPGVFNIPKVSTCIAFTYCTSTYVYMHVRMYTHTYVCTYLHMFVYLCMYVHIIHTLNVHLRKNVCTYCTYIHAYLHIP